MNDLPERIVPADWMSAAPTRTLLAALAAGGVPARFVGGCVRDAILGLKPADIDIATPEEPQTVLRRLQAAKLKAVPTGIEHGTVTAVVPPAVFQITTLRRDVLTDGRHAVVSFGTDWAVDAQRRDFTINALYADADGRLHDFVGGRADLAAGIVRFIGNPAERVAEDYLRVLRFFRFHARFARGAPDAASVAACAAAADRLGRLSGERIRDELLKILALPNAAAALALMQENGILASLLPEARFDAGRIAALADLQRRWQAQGGMEPEVWPRLAALLDRGGAEIAEAVADRLRLSNAQRLRLAGLMAEPDFGWAAIEDTPAFRRALYHHGAERCRDRILLSAASDPSRQGLALQRLAEATAWQRPVFPLRGSDVLAMGFSPGPTVSALLREMEAWWADGGFQADRAACLQHLQARVKPVAEG